jgi:hypothetical protein
MLQKYDLFLAFSGGACALAIYPIALFMAVYGYLDGYQTFVTSVFCLLKKR